MPWTIKAKVKFWSCLEWENQAKNTDAVKIEKDWAERQGNRWAKAKTRWKRQGTSSCKFYWQRKADIKIRWPAQIKFPQKVEKIQKAWKTCIPNTYWTRVKPKYNKSSWQILAFKQRWYLEIKMLTTLYWEQKITSGIVEISRKYTE